MDPIERINLIEQLVNSHAEDTNEQLEILKTEITPPPPDQLEVVISATPTQVSVVQGTQITLSSVVNGGVQPYSINYFRDTIDFEGNVDTPPVGTARYRAEVVDAAGTVVVSNVIIKDIQPVVPLPGNLVNGVRIIRNFTLPNIGGGVDRESFAYGGRALSIRDNNLFVGGFEEGSRVGEVTIPTSGVASLVQFGDPLNGQIGKINPSSPNKKVIGGTLFWRDRLIVAAYDDYDANASQQLSHFVRPASISDKNNLVGPIKAGSLIAGMYSAYMCHIPTEWQSKLGGLALTGNGGINIISRSSYGPSAHSFDPDRIGSAKALVYYPDAHQTLGSWYPPPKEYYGQSDQFTGCCIVPGTKTLLFSGRHGTTACYGSGAQCNDPVDGNQGTHGYPYQASIWAYNLDDCARAVAGLINGWDVKPYARFVVPVQNVGRGRLGGMAIKPDGKIYISHMFGDGARPRIYELEATF